MRHPKSSLQARISIANLVFVASLLFAGIAAKAESSDTKIGKAVAGVWQATFPNGEDTVVIRIRKRKGVYRGVLRSDRWGGISHELNLLSRAGRTLHLEAPALNATLELTLNEGGTRLTGSGTRGTRTVPFEFRRVSYTLPENHHRASQGAEGPKPPRLFMEYFLTTLGHDEAFRDSVHFADAEEATNLLFASFGTAAKASLQKADNAALVELETFLSENPDNPIRGIVVYYYLQGFRDQTPEIPELASFEAALPDPFLANDPLSRICIALSYREYILTARKQGLRGTVEQFASGANDLLYQLMTDLPDDPYQVVSTDFYAANALLIGGNAIDSAHGLLTSFMANYPDTLLAWASRYSVAKLSKASDTIEDESRIQYEKLISESQGALIQDALASTEVVPDVKCVVETLVGHAQYGSGKVADSVETYNHILDTYEMSANRDVVSFALAKALHVLNYATPASATDGYEAYLAEYPSGDYVDEAYYRLGDAREKSGNLEGAQQAYSKVISEFPVSARAKASASRIEVIKSKRLPSRP